MRQPHAEEVIAAARWAGAHELILHMPQGYDTKMMSGGFNLTPGQSQRIALARALYGSPKLLVLDEPNSNLDGDGEIALTSALEQARQRGITTIVIAHRLSVLAHANKALLLREGTVQAFGARDDVLARVSTKASQSPPAKIVSLANPAPAANR